MAATGTMTQAVHRLEGLTVIDLDWTSDAGGDVEQAMTFDVDGAVARVETVPSSTAAPTADYDIVLNSEKGVDIAGANLADRSATAAEGVDMNPAVPVKGPLTLVVSTAGNTKSGQVRIFVYAF